MTLDSRTADDFDERDPARRLRTVRESLAGKAGAALAAAGLGAASTLEAPAPGSRPDDEKGQESDEDLAALRALVAEERGAPHLADRLAGSTVEEITADCDDLLMTIARTGGSEGLTFDQGNVGPVVGKPPAGHYVMDGSRDGRFVPDAADHGAGVIAGSDVTGSIAAKGAAYLARR